MRERYSNKRIMQRSGNGRFRKATLADVGISGVCSCGHFMFPFYDGDKNEQHPDPRKFRNRCFTCEPSNEKEAANA